MEVIKAPIEWKRQLEKYRIDIVNLLILFKICDFSLKIFLMNSFSFHIFFQHIFCEFQEGWIVNYKMNS